MNDGKILREEEFFLFIAKPGGVPGITPGYYEDSGAARRRRDKVAASLPEGWTIEIATCGGLEE